MHPSAKCQCFGMSKMSNMEKTIKEWLEELPDGYRERAIVNTEEGMLDASRSTLLDAIYGAFIWEDSPEGHWFWKDVFDHYAKGTPLPPLP